MEGLKHSTAGIKAGSIVVGIFTGGCDIWNAHSQYSMDMEQIDYSKNEYVQANKPML